MYRRSFLHPTNRTGVCGQNLLISGYHITLQFRKETGLVMEKHSNTTSDLIKTLSINIDSRKNSARRRSSLTCRMRNVDPSRDRQMCPRDVASRLHCLLPPKIAPTPDTYHTMFNIPLHISRKINSGEIAFNLMKHKHAFVLTEVWVKRIKVTSDFSSLNHFVII